LEDFTIFVKTKMFEQVNLTKCRC